MGENWVRNDVLVRFAQLYRQGKARLFPRRMRNSLRFAIREGREESKQHFFGFFVCFSRLSSSWDCKSVQSALFDYCLMSALELCRNQNPETLSRTR